ncbi:hypothetical protein H8356DRAFT_1353491 [Neocallimastix lanati (nom. inval.)]|nr:hypothetical protein H8356DRAFT_1353491 [Neocallimastix sp. JGI-2020a]
MVLDYEYFNFNKIKTKNTVDLRFNGRYFYARDHLIKKSTVNLPFSKYKEVEDKYVFKSENTFINILIASYQKGNLEIYTQSSTNV